ncbi:FAD-binding oxidoreductase [Aeromicrobium senzhongii]|uniref:Delta(24)-sterol reductase n=1 Tax=Aeromicrobium senzhongii TaxID=2663859 RepID=A0ABX6STE4_9ACTN|nr:FAD-binding protein [Aeromicrobium senzhongii]QNL94683.1 FAD-binding oxidoreductase [Aeromicrobium senzhongii]
MQGWTQHQDAVAALRASWDAIGPGQPVRLAKKTSNLFRPRSRSAGPGLDVSGLDGVIAIDPDARTADVQGMCTYERLVDETLAHDLMPSVVPQLRTITLGGAVTGLGIESTSLRLGLPHEAVLEMDVLTGSGEIVTATPDNEHAELFAAFPNSYGSLGYAVRLRIELQPAPRQVRLRHVPFAGAADVVKALAEIADAGRWDGVPVDAVDGTAFSPDEIYLTLAQFTDADLPTSDYTGQDVYYRSIRQRHEDVLTIHDYLWRWDTDWFWCSGAFGAQNPSVRRLWPRRWRRSDVYHRLVALDGTVGVSRVLDRIKHVPARERVIQDIEVPLDRLEDFLTWFDREVVMRPVWLCPLRTRRAWPTYPLTPGDVYVNVGFWGTVVVPAGSEPGAVNRKVEGEVHRLGGHKSLYSEAFYDRETFGALYDTAGLDRVRSTYDPDSRLNTLYDKAVRNS